MTSTHITITPRNQRGLSLVEFMIALVLGLFLVAGVLMLFVGSKQAYRFNDSLARQQETARFAIEAMARDLRMAGYLGCASRGLQPTNTLKTASLPASFDPGLGLVGWEASDAWPDDEITYGGATTSTASGWSTTGGVVLDTFNAMGGSDIVRAWFGDNPVAINSISAGASTVVNVVPNSGFTNGTILLLHDCSRSYWVQACHVQNLGPPANPTSTNLTLSGDCTPGNNVALPVSLGPDSQAMRLTSRIYYVGKRANAAANPPALFRRELSSTGAPGDALELVEGVESIQVLYGIDTDNDGIVDQFVTANNVGNWSRVTSVRISLLLVSTEDNLLPEITDVVFDGRTLTPTDRRARQVVTSTITLRNRLP